MVNVRITALVPVGLPLILLLLTMSFYDIIDKNYSGLLTWPVSIVTVAVGHRKHGDDL